MNYDFLKQFLYFAEQYEQELKDSKSFEDFAYWLNQKVNTLPTYLSQGDAVFDKMLPNSELNISKLFLEASIARLLSFVYRYAKIYIKKALEDTELATTDEFGYLAALSEVESMTKIELIAKNIHEKTTGMEIIKRLLKANLIAQVKDINDKRSTRISITKKGEQVFFGLFAKMTMAADLITADLNEVEKWQFFQLLNKLECFHSPVFLNEKHLSLEELYKKIKKN
ncbi:MAG: MarR family transcriptional regulator [Bacteroidetes bacterium]|nr:MAG: MarR family transcriptional regulator [Bacteroidota bacterium]